LSRPFASLLLWTGLCLLAIPGRCPADAFSEEAVKAAYLHRFAAYVEWPESARPANVFTIGVMGPDGVLDQLRQLLPSIKIHGRPAAARTVSSVRDLKGVSILYIARGRLAQARPVIAAAIERSVLVVTDEADGLKTGSVINFIRAGPNIRFEVSQRAADRSGLKVDAALLGVALRVETR